MTPTRNTALLVAGAALAALFLPLPLAVGVALLALGAAVVDAWVVRGAPEIRRRAPATLSRGTAAPFHMAASHGRSARIRLRQPLPPDLRLSSDRAVDRLDAELTAARRGRHALPEPATLTEGPLQLGAWAHRPGEAAEVIVYPDLPTAWRLAAAARTGRMPEAARQRGPLGLGTDFESIRDYLPDDDVRQVNWNATVRTGRPMSNQFRVEQDRDVICVLDAGRLMAAPLDERTRLDAAVDAAAAVFATADAVGDRCGTLAFDSTVRKSVAPRRRGGRAALDAIFDLEPSAADSDYELAFRTVGGGKRALVIVLTDLMEETAARPLIDAIPVLARRHAVVVASPRDQDVEERLTSAPQTVAGVHEMTAALEVDEARRRVGALLRRSGADIVEAPADRLAAACVQAYLKAKGRARL